MRYEQQAHPSAIADLLAGEFPVPPAVKLCGTLVIVTCPTADTAGAASKVLKLHGYQVTQASFMLAVGPKLIGNPFIDQRFFQHVFQQHLLPHPTENYELYRKLITEELKELDDANNAEEHLDALIDLIYVTIGAGIALGHDMQGAWNEVHTTNMAKLGPDGKPIIRPDGKVIKPAGWKAPQLQQFVGHTLPQFEEAIEVANG